MVPHVANDFQGGFQKKPSSNRAVLVVIKNSVERAVFYVRERAMLMVQPPRS